MIKRIARLLTVVALLGALAEPAWATGSPAPYWQRGAVLATGFHPESIARQAPGGRLIVVSATSSSSGRTGDWTVRFRVLGPHGWSPPRSVATVRRVQGWLQLAAAVSDDRVVTVVGRPDTRGAQPRLELREQGYGGRTVLTRVLGHAAGPDVAVDAADSVAVVAVAAAGPVTAIGGWTVSRTGRVGSGAADSGHRSADDVEVLSAPHVYALRNGVFGLTYLETSSSAGGGDAFRSVEATDIVDGHWSRGAAALTYNRVTDYGSAAADGRGIVVAGDVLDPRTRRTELGGGVEDPQGDWFATRPAATNVDPSPPLGREVSAYSGFQISLVAVVAQRAYLSNSWGEDWVAGPMVPGRVCGGGAASSAFAGHTLTWVGASAADHGRCSVVAYSLRNLY